MKQIFSLGILLFCSLHVLSQGRNIDLACKILDPVEGDTFISPSKKTISVYLYNNGPDTIIPKDEYSVKFIFSAFHIFPEFKTFNTTVLPGDSFLYQKDLDIEYEGDASEMKFCAEAFSYSGGSDSIKKELNGFRDNNRHCITTTHVDNYNLSVQLSLSSNLPVVYYNPRLDDFVTVGGLLHFNEISIYTMSGRLVEKRTLEPGTAQTKIQTHSLGSGIHFIHVRGDMTTKVLKFIVLN